MPKIRQKITNNVKIALRITRISQMSCLVKQRVLLSSLLLCPNNDSCPHMWGTVAFVMFEGGILVLIALFDSVGGSFIILCKVLGRKKSIPS